MQRAEAKVDIWAKAKQPAVKRCPNAKSMVFRTCIDPELQLQKSAINKLSSDLSLKWVSAEVVGHSLLASTLSSARAWSKAPGPRT